MKNGVIRSLALTLLGLGLLSLACAQQQVDDATVTTKVKAEFLKDGRVSPTRVSVETTNGVVTLKGEVPTQQEKDAAEQAAKKVEGVKSVKNEITVNPAAAGTGVPSVNEIKSKAQETAGQVAQEARGKVDETVLLSKAKARLVAAGYSEVSVTINQDQATLTGEVKSEKDRIAAEAIVEKVEGIKKVNNQLTVKRP